MTPYIVTFFMLALLSFTQYTKGLKKYKRLFFLFASTYLILFAGLRQVGVGADDFNYYDMFIFKAPDLYDWIFGNFVYDIKDLYMEPGYVFINSFLRVLTNNYTFLFLTISFMSVGIASYSYNRYSKYVFLTLLLFFVHTYLYRDMNQIRSGVAAAIGLFLIAQIYHREHLKVFFTLFIMSLFHIASVTLIFAYFMSFVELTRKRAVLAYAGALFLGMIGVSQLLLNIIPGGGFLAMKLYSYTANERYVTAISLFDITNVKNSFILFGIILFWNRLEKVVPYFKTIVLFYLMAVVIRIAFYDLGVLSARISTFFGIVEVVIIPYFIYIFRQKRLITFLIIVYAFLMLYLNLFVKQGRYPYELSIF
jgi:hypothetical protein